MRFRPEDVEAFIEGQLAAPPFRRKRRSRMVH